MPEFMGMKIEKGDTVPVGAIIKSSKKPINANSPTHVAFAVMNFARMLEKSLRREGLQANVKATRHGATWLSDADAVPFNVRRRVQGERKVRRSVKGFSNIDETKLDKYTRHEFDRESRLAVQKAAALRRHKSVMDLAKPSTVKVA